MTVQVHKQTQIDEVVELMRLFNLIFFFKQELVFKLPNSGSGTGYIRQVFQASIYLRKSRLRGTCYWIDHWLLIDWWLISDQWCLYLVRYLLSILSGILMLLMFIFHIWMIRFTPAGVIGIRYWNKIKSISSFVPNNFFVSRLDLV